MAPRVLGIDPGSVCLGWGVVVGGARPTLAEAGDCRAPARHSSSQRLIALSRQLEEVLQRLGPDCVAMESPFHGKSAQALLRLGEARGMVIGLVGRLDIPLFDYSPAVIKKAVTGRGNASKDGVARMVRAMLIPGRGVGRVAEAASSLNAASLDAAALNASALEEAGSDVTDALAVALCHLHHERVQRTVQRLPTRQQSGDGAVGAEQKPRWVPPPLPRREDTSAGEV